MSNPKLENVFWSDDKKFVLQYHKETYDLYVNNKKVAYDLTLTWWQNILTVLVSCAVIIDCAINVLTYLCKS